jgi:hypothetical protein
MPLAFAICKVIISSNHEVSASVGFNYGENEQINVVCPIMVALTERWGHVAGVGWKLFLGAHGALRRHNWIQRSMRNQTHFFLLCVFNISGLSLLSSILGVTHLHLGCVTSSLIYLKTLIS